MKHKDAAAALNRASWHKSSRSQGQSDCVEVARAAGWVGIRDSKTGADSPILVFPTGSWPASLRAKERP